MVQKLRIQMSKNGTAVLDGNVDILIAPEVKSPQSILSQMQGMVYQARRQYGVDFSFSLVDVPPPQPSVPLTDEAAAMPNVGDLGSITHDEVETLLALRAGTAKLQAVAKAKPAKKATKKAAKPAKKAPAKAKKHALDT